MHSEHGVDGACQLCLVCCVWCAGWSTAPALFVFLFFVLMVLGEAA